MSDDWIVSQLDADRNPGPTIASQRASQPDNAARANVLARKLGLPPETVERNYAEVEQLDQTRRATREVSDHPYLSQWYSNPRNAAAARDDTPAMRQLSENFQNAWKKPEPKTWWQTAKDLPGNIGGALAAGAASAARGITNAAESYADLQEQYDPTVGLQRRLLGGTIYDPFQKNLDRYGKYQESVAQAFRPKYDDMGFVARNLYQGVESVPTSVAALAAAVGGTPATGLALLGASTYGQSYQEARDKGLSPTRAAVYGGGQGAVEVLTERIPVLKYLEDVKVGTPFFKRLAKNFVAENIGEQAATALQDFNTWATIGINEGKTFGDYLRERPEAAAATALAVATSVGASNIAITASEKTAQAIVRTRRDTSDQAGIMAAAEASKLRQRDPEAFRQFAAGLSENTPQENIYIPAEAIRALNQDYRSHEFFSDYADQIDEALALDGDVVFPTADVAARFAGTPDWQSLQPEARFSPGGMSQAELDSLEKSYGDHMERMGSQAAEQAAAAQKAAEPATQVYQEVRDQLANAGFAPDAADRYAQLWAANREAWGARLGTDALTYHRDNPVEFRRILPEAIARVQPTEGLDLVINAMKRDGDVKRGPSLLDFIAKRGGVTDPGGDLASMGADRWHREKKFRKRLIRPGADARQAGMLGPDTSGNAYGIDDTLQAAVEAGYFPELVRDQADSGTYADKLDTGPLLDAMREELAGRPRYADDGRVDEIRAAAQELRALLEQRGIDPDKASAAEIKDAVARLPDEDRAFQEARDAGRTLEQGGVTLFHGSSRNDLTRDGIEIIRTEGQKQGKRGRIYGGFYAADEASISDAEGYAGEGGTVYRIDLKPDAKIEEKNGDITRLSEATIKEYRDRGVDVVKGKDPRGRTEYAIINRDAISNIADRNAVPLPSGIDEETRADMEAMIAAGTLRGQLLGGHPLWVNQDSPTWYDVVYDHPAGQITASVRIGDGGAATINIEGEIPNQLGPGIVRRLAVALKKAIPEATSFVGDRTTGARSAYGPGERMSGGISLERILNQGARGRTLGGVISGQAGPTFIDLFEHSDLSTVIHETGHVWLEELRRNAENDAAPDDVKADWEAAQRWFRDNGHEPIGADGFISTDAQELWARGWERYALEGKAPASGLRRVFDAFRGWLLGIYKHVANLNANLTPDIRAVFDRMLATQDAIETERQQQNLRLAFDRTQLGMTEAEYGGLQQLAGDARSEAFDALLYKTMESIRRARTKAWKDERANVAAEVTDAVNRRSDFRALELLRHGRWLGEPERESVSVKLDRAWLVEEFGEDALDLIPKNVPPLYKERGDDVDSIAEMAGFRSGTEMVRALMGIELNRRDLREVNDKRSPYQKTIDDRVDEIMRERHGDPLSDGSIEEEALAAIHNDKQGEVIATEARALARKSGNVPTPYQAARTWAREKIATGKVADVISRSAIQQYARATAKAARAAETAMLAGDADETFRQKQAQMLNHALLVEAKAAADEMDATVARLSKIAKQATSKTIDQEYLERAHGLLEAFDLRPRSQTSIDAQERFVAWAEKARADGVDVAVPPRFEDNGTHYTRVPVQDLRALNDAVMQQVYLGRHKQRLLDERDKRTYNERRAEMIDGMLTLPQRNPDPNILTRGGKVRQALEGIHASMLKMERVFDILDGGRSDGPFNRLVWQPLADAQHRENTMVREHGRLDLENVKAMGDLARRVDERVDVPELPSPSGDTVWTRSQLWQMAKQFGNESNARVLCEGYGWNPTQAFDALDRELSKEEWDHVQGDLDIVNRYWPDIKAMYERVNGIAPPNIEARVISTRHGDYAGGYYPLVPDSTKNPAIEQKIGADDLLRAAYVRATTRNGFINERTGATYVVSLDAGNSRRHVVDVIHDLTHREALMQATRFLSDPGIKTGIRNVVGLEVERQLEPWIKHVANGNAQGRVGTEALDSIASKLKTNMSIMGLGFRISTILQQIGGFANSVEALGSDGERWMASGFKSIMGMGARDAVHFVTERSGEVLHRIEQVDETQRVEINKLYGKGGLSADVKRFAYTAIGWMDRAVVIPTWHAAYNKAQAQGLDEEQSIQFADKIVRGSQGAGGAMNTSAVQRYKGLASYFTLFFSYGSAYYNRQAQLASDWRSAVGERRTSDVPRLLARTWWLMLAPNLVSAGITAFLGGGPDDDESWASWFALNSFVGMFAGVPYARDLLNALKSGYDYSATPLDRFGNTLVRTVRDVWHATDDYLPASLPGADPNGETRVSDRAVKNAIESVGYITGQPLGQASTAVQFATDWANGKQHPETVGEWMRGLQTGKAKKDN